MKTILIPFILLFFYFSASAQNTVGTISYEVGAQEGFTLFSPFSSTKAFMVDNCGNLINEWDRGTRPGLSAYFLDNGLLLRTFKADLEGPFTSASNAGGLELVDWNNNTVWSYEINTEDHLSHHDAVMMPNGNILVLTWKLVFEDDLIDWGRDPQEIAPEKFMWSERILELQPIGTNQAEILWEWNIYDHYIQDFDETKQNFGVVSEHPELFDINLPDLTSSNSNATRDWNHFNAIDFNPELDQILLSVRNSDEIWILDHSTTTEEAATHEGGNYGQGGDILYRWGNASAYKGANIDEQKLFGQHGVHWITEGEEEGKIMIYNNGNGRPGPDFSQVDILEPDQTAPGFYFRDNDAPFGPELANSIYGTENGENFYSAFLSNAQTLPNGNVLVNQGSPGRIFEITQDREVVWSYIIPLFGDFPATQGQNVNNNSNFRAYKYAASYSGFDGIDIVTGAPIEINPSACDLLTSVNEIEELNIKAFYNASLDVIEFEGIESETTLNLYDVAGNLLYNYKLSKGQQQVEMPNEIANSLVIAAFYTEQSTKSILFFVQ